MPHKQAKLPADLKVMSLDIKVRDNILESFKLDAGSDKLNLKFLTVLGPYEPVKSLLECTNLDSVQDLCLRANYFWVEDFRKASEYVAKMENLKSLTLFSFTYAAVGLKTVADYYLAGRNVDKFRIDLCIFNKERLLELLEANLTLYANTVTIENSKTWLTNG